MVNYTQEFLPNLGARLNDLRNRIGDHVHSHKLTTYRMLGVAKDVDSWSPVKLKNYWGEVPDRWGVGHHGGVLIDLLMEQESNFSCNGAWPELRPALLDWTFHCKPGLLIFYFKVSNKPQLMVYCN